MVNLNEFNPDWVSPPGDTIADALKEFGWKRKDFAGRMGVSEKHVSQLISGKAKITENTASVLAKVLGSTAAFWLRREANYRAGLELRKERKNLESWTAWLDNFPVRQIMKSGFIPEMRIDRKNKPEIVNNLLRFFGMASPGAWKTCYGNMETSFRRSRGNTENLGAISVWLRAGEKTIEQRGILPANPYKEAKFKKAVYEIRELTGFPPEKFEAKMKDFCGRCGVILLFVPSIRGAGTSGVARWLGSPAHPVIQLSLYGKDNDRFWFTFFHEAAHILLHRETKTVFVDSENGSDKANRKEKEANKFAADILIPEEYAGRLDSIQSPRELVSFAKEIGIHPGIVVGRMQHKGILPFSHPLNSLKTKFEFKER